LRMVQALLQHDLVASAHTIRPPIRDETELQPLLLGRTQPLRRITQRTSYALGATPASKQRLYRVARALGGRSLCW
jgi:hypothetical protein